MRNLDETNWLLAEKEEELAQLDARRAELLTQITYLQQEKASVLQLQETLLPPAKSPSVTNQSGLRVTSRGIGPQPTHLR